MPISEQHKHQHIKTKWIAYRWLGPATLFLLLCILSFNGYYFFYRRSVGPMYYIDKMFSRPVDRIAELSIYQDLKEEYEYLNRKSQDRPYVIFAGDSITKRFNVCEFFHRKDILNRGIYSDTTIGLLERVDSNINNLEVQSFFLLIGFNDLVYRDDETIAQNILDIISKVSSVNKYVLSLLPVNAERNDFNIRIDFINMLLSKNAESQGYIYIDLNKHFKDESGFINPAYTRDGIHPNYAGYNLWYSIIKQYL